MGIGGIRVGMETPRKTWRGSRRWSQPGHGLQWRRGGPRRGVIEKGFKKASGSLAHLGDVQLPA